MQGDKEQITSKLNKTLISRNSESEETDKDDIKELDDRQNTGLLALLNLYRNDFNNVEIDSLISVILSGNCTLTSLNFGCNSIALAESRSLIIALQRNSAITVLTLNYNRVTEGIADLFTTIQDDCILTSLTALDLSGNQISDLTPLTKLLQSGKLKSLNLYRNQISEKGIKNLSAALRNNTTLRSLNLGDNKIGNVGLSDLANTALNGNHSLTKLNFSSNQISDEGMSALASALQDNHVLKSLNFFNNRISDIGIWSFMLTILFQANRLKSLNFSNNEISFVGMAILAVILQNNSALKKLSLSYNRIDDIGLACLAPMLKSNRNLELFNLRGNQISNIGIKVLVAALKNNNSLLSLDLEFNWMTEFGIETLTTLVQNNHTLMFLNLRRNGINENDLKEINALVECNQKCFRISDPIEKANLILRIKKISAVVPSLVSLGMFSVKKHLNLEEIKNLENRLPREIYHQFAGLYASLNARVFSVVPAEKFKIENIDDFLSEAGVSS